MTATYPATPVPAVPTITPEPDSRLDQLAAEYAALEPLATEYAARLAAIKNGIKAELATAAPEQQKILLRSSHLAAPLKLEARTSARLDTKALKRELPGVYAHYATASTTWYLVTV